MRTNDYYLIKKNTTKRIMFPAREVEGYLVSPQGTAMVVGEDVAAAGFKSADFQKPFEQLTDAQREIVLHVGDNRGHMVKKRETPTERKAREKAERDKQNTFLKERGYRWEKRNFYCSGDIGDLVERWFLIDSDGEAVVGAKDGGGFIAEFGSVKSILTELGYYGQEAIDKAAEETKDREERHQMRAKVDDYFADDANRTGEIFEDAQSQFTVHPIKIEKHYPRRQFRIESDCIWHERHNSSAGDDWALNNCDYGIATQYKLDAEIADCLRSLAS